MPKNLILIHTLPDIYLFGNPFIVIVQCIFSLHAPKKSKISINEHNDHSFLKHYPILVCHN